MNGCHRQTSRWVGVLAMLLLGGSATSSLAQPAPHDSARAAGAEAQDEWLARRGFYQRRARGMGWFMTHGEPAFAHRHRLSDLLGAAPGVNVVARGDGAWLLSNRNGRACPLAVFVDGSYTTIRNVDELVLKDIAAVEVYRGPAEVPIAFHAPTYDRTCGALIVWSRFELDG